MSFQIFCSSRLKIVCDLLEHHAKNHEEFTNEVIDEQNKHNTTALEKNTIDQYVKTLSKRANQHLEAMDHRDEILEEAEGIEQYETFLETAPQTILQLYIVFQQPGKITSTQWTTLVKCFCFFLMGAMSNILGPTKVSRCLIRYGRNC